MKASKAEWAVLVRTQDDAQMALDAARAHNDYDGIDCAQKVGSQLACQGLLKFGGQAFLMLSNDGGGGTTATSAWLHAQLPHAVMLWPGEERPEGWEEGSTLLWQPPASPGALPECVPVASLPLPNPKAAAGKARVRPPAPQAGAGQGEEAGEEEAEAGDPLAAAAEEASLGGDGSGGSTGQGQLLPELPPLLPKCEKEHGELKCEFYSSPPPGWPPGQQPGLVLGA